ncbi:hypothetical protein [uncultured Halomonas sp.]|jgi:hypothetical protein|nr:hypothetical protein [uncultured Halomonas sp.]
MRVTARQLAALTRILDAYRAEPLTPAVLGLALRLARMESPQ